MCVHHLTNFNYIVCTNKFKSVQRVHIVHARVFCKNIFLQKYEIKNLAIKLGGRNGLRGHAVMYQVYEQSAPWTVLGTDRTVMF
jgi:hypothetical protein